MKRRAMLVAAALLIPASATVLAAQDALAAPGCPSAPPTSSAAGARQMEDLNRGLISVRSGSGNYVSWRMLGTDPSTVSYNLYRGSTRVASQSHTNFGSIISSKANPTGEEGPGRGVADDVYAGNPGNPGAEYWGSGPGMTNLFSSSGASVGRTPSSANFVIWWDADPVRELLDQTRIDKYGTGSDSRLLTASGVASNNGTKATPALSADLFGDWREEVIWRTSNSSALRIYTTTTPTTTRIFTLMHDAQYRVAIAWQNTAYNQPPHPSFFIGNGMSTPPQPNIYLR